MWLWSIAVVAAFIALYVLWLRSWLKSQPWAQGFFAAIEPAEIWLWSKSETILWSRFLIIAGLLPPILDQFQALQGTPLVDLVPEQYRSWLSLAFTVCGIISELLRRNVSKPLEVVALPDATAAAMPSVVAAEVAKEKAVAAVETAKASGAA